MFVSKLHLLTIGVCLVLLSTGSRVYAYLTDRVAYAPSNYLTFLPPPSGGSYLDAVFGTAVKRLSDSMNMIRADTGGTLILVTPEYSTMSPFNAGNTRLLLQHFSYFALYDGAGNYVRNLPFEINSSSEPRWSRTDSDVLYYRYTNQLKKYNVATGSMSTVHTFSEYALINGRGESDISFDGDHFVLVGDNRYVFVYEMSTDTKGNVYNTNGVSFDSVYITPNNNVTITWNTRGTGRSQGIELFDRNMNFIRQLARAGGHMDVTRDTNGDEVLVWMNSNDLTPICNNGVVKIRIADGRQTCLVTIDWSLAAHVSGPDNSGWVFVETVAPYDPIPPSGWFAYTNEVIQIKLDGSEVRRLAHHRSRPFNSYTYQPKVSVSRDGSRLVYASNFGLQRIPGYPTEYSDAYMITLETTPPPAPSLSATFAGSTGQDYVGMGSQVIPNGIPDWRFQVQGLRGTPTRIRITSNTGGIWETPHNGYNWLVAAQYGPSGTADFWIEPWTSQSFNLKVWYSNGTTDETSVANSTSTLTASYLGVTGQDYAGTGSQITPNGTPDWHIQLQGLRGTPTRIQVTSNSGGVWESPYNGSNWLVAAQYGPSGAADFWFEPWPSQSFQVKVWYANGTTDQANVTNNASVLKAFFVGITGQDYAGTGGQLIPNGNPDFHLQLQGLQGTPTRIRITSNTGGIWETPYNGSNWLVAAQYGSSGTADFWFEPWSSQSFHVKVWYSNGTTDEVDSN